MEEKTAIEKLYENPKSKNFVNHLIRAYLPIDKSSKVWEFEDKKENGHKCNVCGHDLIDLSTIMVRMQTSEGFMNDTIRDLRLRVNGESIAREDNAMYKHITHGAIMAWTGEKTTTHLCLGCIEDLLHMVENGILCGDKNLIWIINQMRRDTVFSAFKESPAFNDEEKKKIDDIKKQADKKKMTFADLDVLQQLKAKMEAEQKTEGEEDLTKN